MSELTRSGPAAGAQIFAMGDIALESGERFGPVTVAYETFGELDAARGNAVLICHALTGDAHASSANGGGPGWWDDMIGPGKAFDTQKYFVVCSNVLGGCRGTTGPSSNCSAGGHPYGLDFPVVTIGDMVAVQRRLMEHLGIERLLAVAGGSMGGMQALAWAVKYPESTGAIIAIATTPRHSPQQIAFNEVGRQAILADPHFDGGRYYSGKAPTGGLSTARMVGHITYMSDQSMEDKFGRRFREDLGARGGKFSADFEVATYLQNKGDLFVKRFDANSYLYITRAVDLFELSGAKPLQDVLRPCRDIPFMVLAFKSDWLYPPAQSKELVRGCKLAGIDVTYCELNSTYGHDAFLLETDEETPLVSGFLGRVAQPRSAGAISRA